MALSIIPKAYCKPLFLMHNDINEHILFLVRAYLVRRILSVPLDGAKKLWARIWAASGDSVQQSQPVARETTPAFVVAAAAHMVLPQRYVGVLLVDPYPEFHFDDRPDRQQLKRQLNKLLDAYHELLRPQRQPQIDEPELLPAALDREERIEQVAARFLEAHDWPLSALPLVVEIFHQLGWSATRVALDAALENGMTVRELELAFHLKMIWEETDKYSQQSRWKNMPWHTAWQIIRSFQAYPQKEELEVLIERLHECWLHTPALYRSSNFFSCYVLKECVNSIPGAVSENLYLLADPDETPFNNYSVPESCDIAQMQLQQRLLELGVI